MWFLNIIAIVSLAVLAFTYWYVRRRLTFWSKHDIPSVEGHWLLGYYMDDLCGRTTEFQAMSKIYQNFRNRKYIGMWDGFAPDLFVIDIELIHKILVNDHHIWLDRGKAFNPDTDPMSDTLVNMNGGKWKTMRNVLSPSYTPGKLKQMFQFILGCGEELEEYLDGLVANGQGFEAREISSSFLTNVNGACVFGIKMDALNDRDLLHSKFRALMYKPSFKQRMILAVRTHFPGLFTFLKLRLYSKEVTDVFTEIFKHSLEYREKNDVRTFVFVDLLRCLKNGEKSQEFDDDLLAAQAFDFFLGSFESGATAISFCIFELAANKEIQERLRDEVRESKALNGGKITWDSLHEMKYLDMVFRETLRKYPLVLLFRRNVKPYRIPDTDVVLPPGSSATIPIHAIHNDPEYYPDPDKFDPERFADEAKNQIPAHAYFPFGSGPRNCIGLRLAEFEVKLAVLAVVDKFEISLSERTKTPVEFDPEFPFPRAKDGIWIELSRKSSESHVKVT